MFWTNFEFLCRSIGKSPNAVAAECGVKSSGTVTGWKKEGFLPRKGTLVDIARYFGIDEDALVSTDLSAIKKPVPINENELDNLCTLELTDLLPEEVALIRAYVSGLKSARKP